MHQNAKSKCSCFGQNDPTCKLMHRPYFVETNDYFFVCSFADLGFGYVPNLIKKSFGKF